MCKGEKKELDFREAGYDEERRCLVLNPDFPGWAGKTLYPILTHTGRYTDI